MTQLRPRRRWYALPGCLLVGSIGLGCLLFWLVVRPIVEDGAGSPVRILVAFGAFIAVVVLGFAASFVSALVIAVRRSRGKQAQRVERAEEDTTPGVVDEGEPRRGDDEPGAGHADVP